MFKNKEGKIRSGWIIAAVTGAFFLIANIIGIIMGIIIGIIINLTSNGQITGDPNQITAQITMISMFLSEIVMILVPIIAWKYIMKRPLSNMGLTSFKKGYKELFVGLAFGAISMTVVFAFIVLTGNATVESWTPHFSADTAIYLVIFILVGLAEEIYSRGFIMATLRQTRNLPFVVLVSSLIFALLHSLNSGISLLPYLNLFLVGFLFAYMYIKSGNIWMCIGYHITWNYFQGNVFGFKVSGLDTTGIITTTYKENNLLNGGTFGPEGGLFVTFIVLIGLLIVHLYYRNRNFDFIGSEPEAVIPNESTDLESDTSPISESDHIRAAETNTAPVEADQMNAK